MTESNTFKISVAKTTIRYSFTRRKAKKWILKGTVLRKAFSNFRVVTSIRVSNSSFCHAKNVTIYSNKNSSCKSNNTML